jgi:hypothetical protein
VSGDYTRFTFKPRNRFSGVLQQQGRVQLDSDWNEAIDIIRHRVEIQALDTFGPVGVPFLTAKDAFKVSVAPGPDLAIAPGRLYVDGLLVECFAEDKASYLSQPFFPLPASAKAPSGSVVVYLDVWEREVTYVEEPSLLDVALGGADTATRTQTVWQLRAEKREPAACGVTVGEPASAGFLSTDAVTPPPPDDPCLLPPISGYRGIENRLYRVEVHKGGKLGAALFKWSRDNGSIVSPVTDIAVGGGKTTLTVKLIGRDQFLRFNKNNWITITDDHRELHGEAGEMAFIEDIDEANSTIVLDRQIPTGTARAFGATPGEIVARHTRVQRWDQDKQVNTLDPDGLMTTGAGPIAIEDGITVSFGTKSGGDFRIGDYWVFWARTATAEVEKLVKAPPRGIRHHYVQLAAITGLGAAEPKVEDCRPKPPHDCCCCCLVTVGKSEDRATDFETLAEAVAKLPMIAPDEKVPVIICLQPGRHEVPETVTVSRPRTTIRGCGFGSRIVGGKVTAVKLAGTEQALEHLAAESDTSGPTIEVTGEKVRIERCRIGNAAKGPALASHEANMLTVRDCEILGQGGLALGGTRLDAADNLISGGPVLVLDRSALVRIRGNHIVGSVGHGIVLGETTLVYFVEIERNLIERAQGIGIASLDRGGTASGGPIVTAPASPAGIATNGGQVPRTAVLELVIDGNRIQQCDGGAYKWSAARPPAGGIVLARAGSARIVDNQILNNGLAAKAPVCGLWIGASRGLIVHRNRIEGNRPAPGAELLGLAQGGIRIEEARVNIAPAGQGEPAAVDITPAGAGEPAAVDITPAAEISENIVDPPFGHALYLVGEGAMTIRDNRLRSRGLLSREIKTSGRSGFDQWGRECSSVFVLNLGFATMFSLTAQAWGFGLATAQPAVLVTAQPAQPAQPAVGFIGIGRRQTSLSGGQVRFTGNQVRLDLRDPGAALVPVNIGIFTADDSLIAHNQTEGLVNMAGPTVFDVIFIDLFAIALTTRQLGNGLFTPPLLTLISLMSFATYNHCLDNQAASCVLPFGGQVASQNNLVIAPSVFCRG